MLTTDDLHHVADMETRIITVGRPIPWAGDLDPNETDRVSLPLSIPAVTVWFLDLGAM